MAAIIGGRSPRRTCRTLRTHLWNSQPSTPSRTPRQISLSQWVTAALSHAPQMVASIGQHGKSALVYPALLRRLHAGLSAFIFRTNDMVRSSPGHTTYSEPMTAATRGRSTRSGVRGGAQLRLPGSSEPRTARQSSPIRPTPSGVSRQAVRRRWIPRLFAVPTNGTATCVSPRPGNRSGALDSERPHMGRTIGQTPRWYNPTTTEKVG